MPFLTIVTRDTFLFHRIFSLSMIFLYIPSLHFLIVRFFLSSTRLVFLFEQLYYNLLLIYFPSTTPISFRRLIKTIVAYCCKFPKSWVSRISWYIFNPGGANATREIRLGSREIRFHLRDFIRGRFASIRVIHILVRGGGNARVGEMLSVSGSGKKERKGTLWFDPFDKKINQERERGKLRPSSKTRDSSSLYKCARVLLTLLERGVNRKFRSRRVEEALLFL